MRFKTIVRLVRDTITEWNEDNVPLLAAALAYYTMFSLAPLLIIAIAIVGAVYGEEAAQGEIVRQIQGLVGRQGAEFIQSMIQNASRPGSGGGIATLIGIGVLIFGASGVFGQLQTALNTIWEVKPKPGRAVKSFVQARFLSFAMVLVIGFLLLVSLILSAVFSGVSAYFGGLLPEALHVGQVLNFVITFALTTLLFAAIYKFLPDVKVPWKNLWVGSAVTALLFNIGKFLIGLYLGNSSVGSTYGAAGSLVVVLLWVFYSAQILLLGAEFTQVYSKYRGRPIEPSSHAVLVKEETLDQTRKG
ncbi:YihY/virulence factor BrkB family protein [Cyanobacteria bacterium FACHB-DQ100]|uniref:YihY/virulence factor BrkB family protein n=1 Tax=Leptolyngbya sp. DQ-M1 TaxID=2933920 RepID=UPI0019B03E47|nr:YihY/virulence factor BrkB family protein [Cyanobacteria bacterium FACHB-DQ100]